MLTYISYKNVVANQSYNVPFSWIDDSQILVSGDGVSLEINVGYTLNQLQGTITPLSNYSELLIVRNTLGSDLSYDFTNVKNLKGSELQRALDIVKSISEESFTQTIPIGELENYKAELDSFRQEAATSAAEANTSAANALNSEEMAYKWAEEEEDVEVLPGKYSAHHWAIKAEAAGGGGGGGTLKFETPITITVGPGGDYATAAEAFTYLETIEPKFMNEYIGEEPQATLVFKTGYIFTEATSVYITNKYMPWLNITQEDIYTPLEVSFERQNAAINIVSSTIGEIKLNLTNTGLPLNPIGILAIDGSFIKYVYFEAFNMKVGISMRNSIIKSIVRLVLTEIGDYGLYMTRNSIATLRAHAHVDLDDIGKTNFGDGIAFYVENSILNISEPANYSYNGIPEGPSSGGEDLYSINNAVVAISIVQQGKVLIANDDLEIDNCDIGIMFYENGGQIVYTNANIIFGSGMGRQFFPDDITPNTWDSRGIIIN